MRLLLLGTGGYHPNERRHTACIMLPELGVLLDAGTGAFRVPQHLESDKLDIFLTHPHLDHIVGLTYFYGLTHEDNPVEITLHASDETIHAVRSSLFDKALFPIMTIDRFESLGERTELNEGAVLRTFELDHPGGSLGMRIDQGSKSFAYVTDTTALKPEKIDHIRGVELLIHEAYFDDSNQEWAEKTGHSTAIEAARTAKAAGAKRLILVHPDPRCEDDSLAHAEASAIFPNVKYGQDGQEVML